MSNAMVWLGLYILTFNCARNPVDPNLLATHLFDALSTPDAAVSENFPEVLVLSLQEIAPLSHAFLGKSWLEPYYWPFRRAVDIAAGDGLYRNLLTRNVGMTAVMVFVRTDVADRVSWVETAEVGIGVQEAGNKGAVGARLGYLVERDGRETVNLTFVAAHLAPDEFAVEKRNQDWTDISRRLVFTSMEDAGVQDVRQGRSRDAGQDEEDVPLLDSPTLSEACMSALYAPNTYLFVAGDLNYRTSDKRPAPGDYLRFPRSTDEVDSPRHWANLLPNDQLTKELKAHRTLQDLTEQPIDFAPTYKFLVGGTEQDEGWKWSKNRWPSWCDRILYSNAPLGRTGDDDGHIKAHNYDALPLFPSSDHRPVALSLSVPLRAAPEPVLSAPEIPATCEIDPTWKSRRIAARRKELLAGIGAYAIFTWEGRVILATVGFSIFMSFFVYYRYLS